MKAKRVAHLLHRLVQSYGASATVDVLRIGGDTIVHRVGNEQGDYESPTYLPGDTRAHNWRDESDTCSQCGGGLYYCRCGGPR